MRDVYSAAHAVERGAAAEYDGAADVAPAGAMPATRSDATDGADAADAADTWAAPLADEATTPEAPAAAAPVTRRRILQVLGTLPLAAGALEALGAQPPTGTAPAHPRQPHTTPNQPAAGAAQPPANRPAPKFFTARELRTAGVLADDIIPRDERSGSATEAGVLAYIDFHMSVPETSTDTRTAMRGGLRWLDVESRRRFGVTYDRASEKQRHALLDDIAVAPATAKPTMRAGATFFSLFRNLVGAGFFSSAMGHRDLQYMGNVFNPKWEGCPKPALDKLGVSYALMETRVRPQEGTE